MSEINNKTDGWPERFDLFPRMTRIQAGLRRLFFHMVDVPPRAVYEPPAPPEQPEMEVISLRRFIEPVEGEMFKPEQMAQGVLDFEATEIYLAEMDTVLAQQVLDGTITIEQAFNRQLGGNYDRNEPTL